MRKADTRSVCARPLAVRTGADTLCRQFMTGGGRAEAAGINHLPREAFPEFARRFEQAFSTTPSASRGEQRESDA